LSQLQLHEISNGYVDFIALWRAIEDARSPREIAREPIGERDRARAWIQSRDFETVCALAGFDPDMVRGRLVDALADCA
jgi:hypothetical protein